MRARAMAGFRGVFRRLSGEKKESWGYRVASEGLRRVGLPPQIQLDYFNRIFPQGKILSEIESAKFSALLKRSNFFVHPEIQEKISEALLKSAKEKARILLTSDSGIIELEQHAKIILKENGPSLSSKAREILDKVLEIELIFVRLSYAYLSETVYVGQGRIFTPNSPRLQELRRLVEARD